MERRSGRRYFSGESNGGPTNKSENLEYRRLLATMGGGPITVDMLVDRTGLTPDAVSSMLRILKLDGHAESLPGEGKDDPNERNRARCAHVSV